MNALLETKSVNGLALEIQTIDISVRRKVAGKVGVKRREFYLLFEWQRSQFGEPTVHTFTTIWNLI